MSVFTFFICCIIILLVVNILICGDNDESQKQNPENIIQCNNILCFVCMCSVNNSP